MSCTTLWKSMVSAVAAIAALGAVQSANAAILQIDTSSPVEFPNSVQVPVNVAAFTGFTPDANGILTITGTINYNTTELDYDPLGTIGQISARFDGLGNVDVVEGPAGTLTFTATTDAGNPILSSEGTVLITTLNFSTTPLQGGNPMPNMTFPSSITFNEPSTTVTIVGGGVPVVQYEDNDPLDILTPQCLYSVDSYNPIAPNAILVPGINFPVEYVNVPAAGITGYDFLVSTPLGCSFNLTIQSDFNVPLPLGSAPRVSITNIIGEAGLGGNGVPSGIVGGNGTNRVTFSLAPNTTGAQITRVIRVTAPDTGRSRFIRLVQDACSFDMLTPAVNNAGAAAVNDFGVTFDTTCSWTASVLDPADTWVLNASGSGIFTASGDGTDVLDGILYDLEANVGPARSATIRVVSDTNPAVFADHTINQDSGCEVLTLDPPSNNVVAAGATGQSFSFTLSDPLCIAETTILGPMVPWITNISAPVEGPAGTFTVTYDVAANVGPARGPVDFQVSAVQNGAPLTHTVTQDNGCSLTIAPNADLYVQAGEINNFDITLSDALCGFTIVEKDALGNVVDVPWVSLSATNGTGNTTISVTADPNLGSARSATLCVIDDNGVETVYTICQEGNSTLEAFFYGDTATILPNEDVIGDPQGLNIFVNANFNDGGIYIDSSEVQVTITGVPSWVTLVEFNGGGAAPGDITIASGPTLELGSDPLDPTFSYTLDMNDNDGVIVYQVAPSSILTLRTANMTLVTGGGIPVACGELLGNEVIQMSITQSADCLYGINPVTASIAAVDDIGTIANELEAVLNILSNDILVNNNGCTWSVSTSTPWIALTAPTSGVGTGAVTYTLSPNPGATRVGTIEVATENGLIVHTVTQAGACGYDLNDTGTDTNPSTKTTAVPAVGGSFDVVVSAGDTCGWTIAENSSWLEIEFDPASGIVASNDGPATFTVTVDANQGPARFTTINLLSQGAKVADKTNVLASIRVEQASGCVVLIDTFQAVFPANENVSGATLTNSFPVSAGDGCTWLATETSPWITLLNAGGTGSGFVIYEVAENFGPRRTATITVGSFTHTVIQESGCVVAVNGSTEVVALAPAAGSTDLYTVTTSGDTCTWVAKSNVPWITINNPAGGNGTGSTAAMNNLSLTVAPNTSFARTGVVTITGDNNSVTITINQEDGCTLLDFTPAVANFNQNAATGFIPVRFAGQGVNSCDWVTSVTYTIGAPGWLSLTEGSTGTGNADVSYNVQSFFTGGTRQATVSVTTTSDLAAGINPKVFTINQTDQCLVSAVPAFKDFDQNGGFGEFLASFNNADSDACPWTASVTYIDGSNNPISGNWVTINSSTSGNGTTQVTYTVNPYFKGGNRRALITVVLPNGDDAVHTVNQTDLSDVDAIPATATLDQRGGAFAFAAQFTTPATTTTTPWTATVSQGAEWLTITSDTAGKGTTQINYLAEPLYTGGSRVGVITLLLENGDVSTHTITQTDNCDVTAVPATRNFTQDGGSGSFLADFADNTTMLGCPWNAEVTSGASWVTITGSTSGAGDSTVEYSVAPFFLGGTRTAVITVTLPNGDVTTHTINQTDNCVPSAVPSTLSYNQNGGTGNFEVQLTNGGVQTCPWSVSTSANWVTITGDGNGAGNGSVQYTVDPFFRGGTRTATITVTLDNGLTSTHTVTQTDECVVTLVQTTSAFNQNGGAGGFSINLQNLGEQTCPWEASTSANWVTITGDGNGAGNSELQFEVAPWFLGTGVNAQRTATITVLLDNGNSATHTITQTNECDVTAVPATATFDQGGNSGQFIAQFAQNNQLDCPWNASVTTGADWITITGTTEGTGTSTISYDIAPFFTGNGNPPVRTGVITVTLTNGDVTTHTITQTDNCDHVLSPTSIVVNNNGGFESFNVNFLTANNANTPFQCPWIARVRYAPGETDPTWVQIVEGSTEGSGNGLVTFNVDPFERFQGTRTAFIDVILDNGMIETFTITQRDLCEFVVYTNPETTRPPSFTFDHNGVLTGPVFNSGENNSGTANFIIDFLNDDVDCEFTVTAFTGDSDQNWINIQEITRNNGDAQVFFEVDPNVVGGPDRERIGSIIIEGDNGQAPIIVTVVQSESFYTLSQLELADPLLQTPAGAEQDGPFGFGGNAVVIGYTDLSGYSIEQDNRPTTTYFTVVDPRTNQTLRASLNVNADARGYISGFVTLVALNDEFFLLGSEVTESSFSSIGQELGEITFPVSGRISYRRSSKTTIQTSDFNYSGLSDVTYNNSFTITGRSSNKTAAFVATGRESRKELRVFEPGQSVGFDVNVAALYRSGDINALGREPRARLLGWNPTSVNLALIKNSFQATNRTNTAFSVDMLLLDSNYSPIGQQGTGSAGFRQRPAIGSRNGAYAFSGRLSTSPVIGFNSSGLHNLTAETFQEEGFPLDGLDRGVNIFPQRTTFSNGQVTINGTNIWTKNLTDIQPASGDNWLGSTPNP